MKTARLTAPLVVTMLLLSASGLAQDVADTSAPTDLVVLEKKWSGEVTTPMRESNPLQPNEDLINTTRKQKEFIKARDNALPNQTTEPSMPASGTKPVTPASEARKTYVYQVKVKNTGAKSIKQVDWEYQFLDPNTQEVKDQRQIASPVKLPPGKSKVLKSRTTRQPTTLVSAAQLGQKYRNQFAERVVITRIVYADGSVWQRAKTD